VSLGLLGAFACAVCYGIGSILQAVAAGRTDTSAALDPRLLVRLLKQGPYLLGVGFDAVGFVASVLALRTLPLFLVESTVASSIGVTAVLAARFLHVRLKPAEWVALGAVAVGLVLLAASAQPDAGKATTGRGGWLLLAGVLVAVVVAAVASRFGPARAGAILAADAGLAFGGVGVAARTLVVPHPLLQPASLGQLARDPVALSLVAYGVLGMLFFSAALQRGSVTTATAITFAIETTVPTLIGLTLLGDRARPGFAPVAVAGFVVALGGCLGLARHADL
jgi:drug/metabolite transporter (DMT)-like permease